MKKAILWTVACFLVVVAAIVGGWTGVPGGWILIALAVVCAALQWLAYLKHRK